jgi:hypothetical protein
MKRWVLVTDRVVELRGRKGLVTAAQLPGPDRYAVGDWIEVVISDGAPRLVWRMLCIEVPLD